VDGTPNEPRNSRGSFGAGIFDDSADSTEPSISHGSKMYVAEALG
jgi:hypothetical protein